MQKKIIALAIAGLSGAAFAQSNVTVYGVVDLTFENVKTSDATNAAAATARPNNIASYNRVSSNSSYVGFKGVEDLGNGLKAKFVYESGFNADNNTGLTGGRDSYVGLDSSTFGGVQLGEYDSATRALGKTIDFTPGYAGLTSISTIIGNMGGIKTNSDQRATNAVMYASPSLAGISGSVAYLAPENKADGSSNGTTLASRDNYGWELGLKYENGPLYVGYAYLQQNDLLASFGGAAATSTDKLKGNRLGAKYTFPTNTTVTALWDSQKYDGSLISGASASVKRNAWELGVKQDFGAHSVFAQYAKSNDLSGNFYNPATSLSNTNAKQWTLGYLYNFSKRTMLKAYYSKLQNGSASTVDFYNNPVSNNGSYGATSVAAGADAQAWGVGLRHSF